MAINYNEYVPIDELIKGFGNLDQANKTYAKNALDLNKQISSSYKEIREHLTAIKSMAEGKGGARALSELARETDKSVEAARRQKEMMETLTRSININDESVKRLNTELKNLKAEHDNLKPSQADYASRQREIAERTMAVKTAVELQTKVLRDAGRMAGSAATSYRELSVQTALMKTQLRDMPNAYNLTTGAINRNNAAAAALQKQIMQNDRALKAMDATMGNHQRNVGHYTTVLRGLGGNVVGAFGALTGVATAFQAISESIGVIDRMERLSISLENASGGSAAFLQNQKMIIGIANQTGTNIESMTRSYVKFTAATQGSKLEGESANKIFETMTKTFAALGASSTTSERGLLAIEQMISKNTVGAEELRQQLGDALPGSVRLFTEAYKELHNMSELTTGEFMKLMKNGKVISEDILPVVARRLEEVYGDKAQRNLKTISGSWTNMTNQLKLFLDYINDDGAISAFFARINNGIASSYRALRENGGLFNPFEGSESRERRVVSNRVRSEFTTDSERSKLLEQEGVKLAALQDRADDIREIFREGSAGGWFKSWALRKELEEVESKIVTQSKDVENLTISWEKMGKAAEAAARKAKIDSGELLEMPDGSVINNPDWKAPSSGVSSSDTDSKLKRTTSEFEKLLVKVDNLRDVLVDQIAKNIDKGLEVKPETRATWDKLYEKLRKVSELTGEELPKKLRDLNEALNPSLKNVLDDDSNFVYGRVQSLDTPDPVTRQEDPSKMKDLDVGKLAIAESNYNNNLSVMNRRFDTGDLRLASDNYKNQLTAVLAEILELEKQYGEESNAASLRAAREKRQRIEQEAKAEIAARKEVTRESIKLASEMVNTIFEINKNFRQAEMDSLTAQMEHDIELAGESEEKKKAIKKSYDRQMKQLRVEQAKADKAQAIFSVGMNTAMAVTNALATSGPIWLGIAMAAIAGAMGALQLATIMSKPLPQFYKGTDYAPEGPAWVAEKGGEIRESNGKMIYYDKPQVTTLKRGDKIYTAEETSRMLAEGFLNQEGRNDLLQRSITGNRTIEELSGGKTMVVMNNNIDYDRMASAMSRAMLDRPVHEIIIDEHGQRKRIRRKNAYIEYLNKIMP